MKTDYRKYRLKEIIGLVKFCIALSVLVIVVVFAPNQATQIAGYIGFFMFGASKAKQFLGL